MNASERLRELGVPIGQAMHADEYAEAAEPLRNALPLIADVVEAAEWAVLNAQLVCDEEIVLDRRLTALRDALEGDTK